MKSFRKEGGVDAEASRIGAAQARSCGWRNLEGGRRKTMKTFRDWRGLRLDETAAEAFPTVPSTIERVPRSTSKPAALVAVKAIHTLAFFSIGSCLAYLFYSGVRRRSDRRAAIAAAVVTGEALIYAGNRMRCPLTGLAERLGADTGSVSDIYLPRWVVSHLAEVTAPIFAEAVVLHAKNISRRAAEQHPSR